MSESERVARKKAQKKAEYLRRREKYRAHGKADYIKNRDQYLKRAKKRQVEKCGEIKAYLREYYKKNPDKFKQEPERRRTVNRAHYKTPHGRSVRLHHMSKRRALLAGGDATASTADVREFMGAQTECFYCRRTGLKLTLDHYIPIGKKGPHSLENFRAACRSCNSRKKDRDPHEFIAWLAANPYPDQPLEKISEIILDTRTDLA